MAKVCNLFFFIKMVPKTQALRSTKMHPESTIIWALGREETAAAAGANPVYKRLEVKLSESLAPGGALGPVVDFAVYYINDPSYDEARAKALLNDKSFTWKDDALAITMHRIDVIMGSDVVTHPFCVPSP